MVYVDCNSNGSSQAYSHNHLIMHIIFIIILSLEGNCITTASPSDVCGLNSFASRCDNSSATNCTCYSGYENVDEKNCKGIICRYY